jgi:hypothetical protein
LSAVAVSAQVEAIPIAWFFMPRVKPPQQLKSTSLVIRRMAVEAADEITEMRILLRRLKQKTSAAAEVLPLSRTPSDWRSLVRRLHPACLRAVEHLQGPQHDDDGRYQRGRHQYTL